ncbi:MAG TPA: hypothetical protein VMG81_03055 [Thermoplasmata archaeon]|nr:hypothetical protein [Thermoplasmata archaeon]
MTGRSRRLGWPGLALSGAVAVVLGFAGPWPDGLGVLVALGSVAGTAGLRLAASGTARELAIAPTLGGLVALASAAPPTALLDLVAGLGGVAAIVWVVDDPDRPPGGLLRGFGTYAIPGLAVGIAWSGAVVLPGGTFSFGVVAALLVLVLLAAAYLTGRPELFDREETSASS